MATLTLVLLFFAFSWRTGVALSTEELVDLVRDLKGNDNRIMRWDATEYTAARQAEGACEKLPLATQLLVNEKDDERQRLACEYATWCITDNPFQRARFSEQDGIHKAVVNIVQKGSPETSAVASHLIYIASFANEKNHQGFYQAGAVKALASVITAKDGLAVQLMWAMAALQNLAASYCATKNNGRCWWEWKGKDHVTIDKHALPVISDGSAVRQQAIKIPGLIPALQRYTCQGPVAGEASETNKLPGENAVTGVDDANPSIIPWAAAGALKNLALEKEAKPVLEGTSFRCYCNLRNSYDWLEGMIHDSLHHGCCVAISEIKSLTHSPTPCSSIPELKANDLISFLRPNDPCWDDEDGIMRCVDDLFFDREGYDCYDYGEPTEEECQAKDIFTGKTALESCCGCGGGLKLSGDHEEL